MLHYYDREGNPIEDFFTFTLNHADPAYAIVAQDKLENGYLVSTIWLGHDMRGLLVEGAGKPLIFETMVFRRSEVLNEGRYSTEEESKAGHLEVIELYKNRP